MKESTSWLVEHHLVMSDTAFKNDTQSSEAIAKFTSIANTEEKINSLFLFTLCDIASVGPNILNEWRISLLRSLFYNAKDFLQRGLDTKTYSSSVQESLKKSVIQQSDISLKKFINKSIKDFPAPFWEALSSRMSVDIFKIYQKNNKAKIINTVNF